MPAVLALEYVKTAGGLVRWGRTVGGGTTPTTPPVFTLGETLPTAANTGVGIVGSSSLTPHAGDYTVTTSNQTIEGLNISGRVIIDTNVTNTTIRNCRIRMTGTYTAGTFAVVMRSGASGVVVEYCEISCESSDFTSRGAANGIGLAQYTLRRCNVHHVVDGARVTGEGVTIEGNYFHDLLVLTPDPMDANRSDNKTHSDVIQLEGGDGTTIRGNRLDGYHSTDGTSNVVNVDRATGIPATPPNGEVMPQALSCLMLTPNVKPITNLTFDRNWVRGGVVGVNGGSGDNSTTTGTLTGNRFSRDQFNALHTIDLDATATGLTTSGNVYEDDVSAVNVRRNQ